MPELRRRNTLIGLGTIVFGTSGFIASGAFDFDSEGSRGDNWIQVEGVEEEVEVDEEDETEVDPDDDDDDPDDDDDGPGVPTDDDPDDPDDPDEEEDEEEETYVLETATDGDGSLSVSPSPPFSHDGSGLRYAAGTEVTLTATPGDGYVFAGWSGVPGSPDDQTVSVVMDQNRSVTAEFRREAVTLSVSLGGEGEGEVTIDAPGDEPSGSIASNESWSEAYEPGTTVTLTAEAIDDSAFAGWSGVPGGVDAESETIAIEMDDDRSVTATFGELKTLTAGIDGEGTVSVTAGDAPSGTIGSEETWQESYETDTEVTLTASPGEGDNYEFVEWAGDVPPEDATSETITVVMDQSRNVTAVFERTFELTVRVSGDGTVEFDGVSTSDSETREYSDGEDVSLTARSADEYEFVEWTGDISPGDAESRTVTVAMTQDRTVTAVFEEEEVEEPTLVQIVADPDNDGNEVAYDGRMTDSDLVGSDDDGFFTGFEATATNRNAVSRIGILDDGGYPTDRIAFLVANVGNPETPGEGGQPVEITTQIFDGDGNDLSSTDQLNFPYRVVASTGQDQDRGADLLDEQVDVPVSQLIEVAIEIDSRNGTDEVAAVETLQFSAESTND